MKRYIYLILILFICFFGPVNVLAETTTTAVPETSSTTKKTTKQTVIPPKSTTKKTVTTGTTTTRKISFTRTTTTKAPNQTTTKPACSMADRAKINKQAYAVTGSYDFTKDEKGNVTFNMSVYNITGDIYVVIKSDEKHSEDVVVFPSQTRGGTYTWNVKNVKDIINYTIKVRSNLTGCIDEYRSLTLTKPMKNPFFGTDTCSYAGLEEYYYCTEWINQAFNVSQEQIEEKIKNELSKYTTSVKTRCIACEREQMLKNAIKAFQEKKSLIIKILVVLIIADVITIVVLLRRIKRYEL